MPSRDNIEELRVAVIGAGVAGLSAIKACLEKGLDVVCFEKTSSFGGLWNCNEDTQKELNLVLPSTITNSSKEMSAFSDFPPPSNFPNYLTQKDVLQYLKLYAEHFHLLDRIRFCTEVVSLNPTEDYDTNGRWKLRFRFESELLEEVFDGVLVCSGQHTRPYVPELPGMRCFEGELKHCSGYRGRNEYEGKNVLVVGAGNSAADVAVDVSTVAKKVFLSCRRGTWLLPRIGLGGLPLDLTMTRILFNLPFSIGEFICKKMVNCWINHKRFGLQSSMRFFDLVVTVNDYLPVFILSGRISIKKGIEKLTKTGAVFENNSDAVDVDSVILATGYTPEIPFLDKDILRDSRLMYKFVLPTTLPHPTLAMIGFVSSIGSLWPIMEMQSRWAVSHLIGKSSLPSRQEMDKEVHNRSKKTKKLSFSTRTRDSPVVWISYADSLADDIGAKPNFLKMAFTDPALYWACVTGPSLPYQFRLVGPNSWAGARKAIMTCMSRVIAQIKGPKMGSVLDN